MAPPRESGRSAPRSSLGDAGDLEDLLTGPPWWSARQVVGMVGTYPPTECGIATFTANLRDAMGNARPDWRVDVVRLEDEDLDDDPVEVVAKWPRTARSTPVEVLRSLEAADLVVLQHEYGIFPGDDGDGVLDLLDSLHQPVVSVLHTVLTRPSSQQSEVLQGVIDRSAAVVLPSRSALERLRASHEVGRAQVIPHGAAPNFSAVIDAPRAHATVLTWGLLGPGKGVEHGIDAIGRLAERARAPRYVVAGHTHPHERRAGDPYRRLLESKVEESGVGDLVRFDNEYRDFVALRALIRTADVVLLPYDSTEQVCSGVLAEAVASGKPVVATRFPHAVELLSDGAGILVDHGDVDAMADALAAIVSDHVLSREMGAASRRAAEPMLWPQVGDAFTDLVEDLLPARRPCAVGR
jgi:glycosyltransferase involved in cell wall biosynthesis